MEGENRPKLRIVKDNDETFGKERGVVPPFWTMRLDVLAMHKRNKFSEYSKAIGEIRKMAKGEEVDTMISQYYPNWEKNDFINLLKALGEEIE